MDVCIAYTMMRKIHYNVMRFRDTLALDEVEVLAGRYNQLAVDTTCPAICKMEIMVVYSMTSSRPASSVSSMIYQIMNITYPAIYNVHPILQLMGKSRTTY
jgi:hypothetical protein